MLDPLTKWGYDKNVTLLNLLYGHQTMAHDLPISVDFKL